MELNRAVEILNENNHNGFNDWITVRGLGAEPKSETDPDDDNSYFLIPFETIACAEKYERQAGVIEDCPECARRRVKAEHRDERRRPSIAPRNVLTFFNNVSDERFRTVLGSVPGFGGFRVEQILEWRNANDRLEEIEQLEEALGIGPVLAKNLWETIWDEVQKDQAESADRT